MSFLDEFKRIFLRQWHSKSKVTILLFPAIVALLIFIAFLWREDFSASKYLMFFTTLYAFWVGLFSSCQLLNGERESGEWAYWVLGFKRPFFKHLVGLVSASLVITFIQLSVLVLSICCLDLIYGEDSLYQIYIYSSGLGKSLSASILFDYPTLFAMLFLGISVFFAGLSGVGIGTLFSSRFKESASSLKVAIAFIVIVLISSYTVLKVDDVSKFAPVYISASNDISFSAQINRIDKAKAENKEIDMYRGPLFLEDLSYLFPQRYFYNLARIFSSEVDINSLKAFENAKENINTNLGESRKIYLSVALWEISILLAYFFVCILISYLTLKYKKIYYELR